MLQVKFIMCVHVRTGYPGTYEWTGRPLHRLNEMISAFMDAQKSTIPISLKYGFICGKFRPEAIYHTIKI